jgi:DtxR family Mn-dependent transcriptional regulator
MEFIQTCPRTGENWLEYFEEYRRHGHRREKCQARCDAFSLRYKKQVDGM